MQPTNPESMTTDERSGEIASILGLALVRAVRSMRSRVSLSSKEVSESSPDGLEDPEDAGLSVSSFGPIGGPDPEPEPDPETQKGDSRDRSDRNRNR